MMSETTPLTSIAGLSRESFATIVKEADQPSFRAKQLWQWVYNKGAISFDEMLNLPKGFREYLQTHYTLDRAIPTRDLLSIDGTRKWLLQFSDKQEAETVYIPEEDRGSLCISSQVGCTLTCKFCHTGTQKLVRNLTGQEIVQQLMLARDKIGDWPSTPAYLENRKISTIVMMGMGEPMYNYDNVAEALKIIMDDEGIALSKRRITLSTSGVVPMIDRLGTELGVNLAISLHAVTDEIRDVIVPLNKKYPIKDLLDACRRYPSGKNSRRITFEYVMLKGINDSIADAKTLIKLLDGIPAKVNLIPFNPWPGAPYECSTNEAIQAFSQTIFDAGLAAPVRTPRGRDIMAACGQLKSESLKKSKAEILRAEAAA